MFAFISAEHQTKHLWPMHTCTPPVAHGTPAHASATEYVGEAMCLDKNTAFDVFHELCLTSFKTVEN